MKIWDKIKEHFFKLFHEEIKQLPESTVEKVSENSGEIWRENLKIEKNQLTKQINEPNQSQLDKAIFQYMDAYYDEWKNAKDLCNKLIILKQNYPRLFSGSEYTNPFVKKEAGFIGISSDPRSDKFIDLHGNSKIIAQSSNSLIAEALQDSMTIAMGQIISKDKSLSEKTDFAVYDFDKYMAVYPELRLNYGNQLLGNMKKFLKKSKENNKDLNIDGLGERINEGMEI